MKSLHRLALSIAIASFVAVPFVANADEPAEHATTEHTGEAAGEHGEPTAIAPWTDPRFNFSHFGAGEDHAAPTHEGHAAERPPPFVANIFNFCLLFLILYFAVKRVVNPALSDRRAAIETEIGEAQRLRSEAEALHREYTERLEKMDDEFAQMRDEFLKLGQAEYERTIEEAKQRAERMRKEAESVLAQEIKQLRTDLIREAVDAAVTSAETVVAKSIQPTDQGRLADEYLVNLGKKPGAAA